MRSTIEWLAAVDEANVVLDHAGQINVFLIVGLLAPGGFISVDHRPDMAALRSSLDERIALIPSLHRFPIAVRGRHRWGEAFPNLNDHVRLIEPVDGLPGLERLCAELMTKPLAPDRPLWELLIVPGASAGRVGVVLRVHRAVADGMAALVIVQQLFERPEHGSTPVVTPAGALPTPAAVPRGIHPLRTLGRLCFGIRRMVITVVGRGVKPTLLLGDRSQRRGVAFAEVDLETLKTRTRANGATVNDALLASACAGYISALSTAGEDLPAELPVSIPVALQRRGTSRNQVGVMLVRLPLAVPDPDERLQLIAVQTRVEKERARGQGTLEFMRGPRGAQIMDYVAHRQHVVAGFVTNVPGPTDMLNLAGAPIASIWPVGVLAGNVRLGVAAVSYAGRLHCGVHFDEATVPGAVFAQAMREELTRLAS